MNRNTILVLLFLLAGAAGVYLANCDGSPSLAPPQHEPRAAEATEEPALEANDVAPQERSVRAAPVRQEVRPQTDPRSFEQGVFGRCVDASNTPVEGVEVFLVEGQGKDIFSLMTLSQRGVVIPPVGRTRTDRLGRFELGLQKVLPDKTYELRFISERYADATEPNITMFALDWVDVGDVALERGATVFGRVLVAGPSGLPLADAEVSVRTPSTFPTLSPTPGRERGIVVSTDAGGYFRFENVKPGVATIAAVAPGFARIERPNVEIPKNAETRLDFQLPEGLSIAGVVTDSEGAVVPGAKITAIAISSKTPVTEGARTDTDGRFDVIGLTAGPFQVTAAAPGFVTRDDKPIAAGEQNLHIVLERQGSASLSVVARGGRLIQRYDVLLKSYFEGQDNFGNVPNAQVHRVFASDLDGGVYTMPGIDPGKYVFQVTANGFAKSFSRPFEVALRKDPDTVVVTVTEGGTIEGTVYGYDGRPLSGVTVTTMPNFLDENPFTQLLGGMIPFRITRTARTTDARGHYRIGLLATGAYQLKFTHPEHYAVYQKDHAVADGQTTHVPDLRMDRGTVLAGTASIDGRPQGQVKITITAAPDPQNPGRVGFNAEAISNNDGEFTIQQRLPPGRYLARAAPQNLPPLMQLVYFSQSQQEFAIGRGQDGHVLHFALTSAN